MFIKLKIPILIGLLTASLLAGCQNAASHRADVQDDSSDRMTVGKVQREIRVGMSSADVAQILGSPNIAKMQNKAFNPVRIGLLCTNAVMFQANLAAHLIQQPGRIASRKI